MSTKQKVWFNKATAVLWIILGVMAFFLGWKDAVWFVVVASVYANVKADWSTAEAADDRALKAQLAELKEMLSNGNYCRYSGDCGSTVLPGGGSAERSSSSMESGSGGTIFSDTCGSSE